MRIPFNRLTFKNILWSAALFGLGLGSALFIPSNNLPSNDIYAQEQLKPEAKPKASNLPLDMTKRVIETPLKGVVGIPGGPMGPPSVGPKAGTPGQPAIPAPNGVPPGFNQPGLADRGKGGIEGPLKQAIGGQANAETIKRMQAALSNPPTAKPATDNPTVEAGKVKWHSTLAKAQEASVLSGKPVLVLHMMGQLDKQFC